MVVAHKVSRISPSSARNALVTGILIAAALVVVALIRYPLDPARTPAYAIGVAVALLTLTGLAVWLAQRDMRPRDPVAALSMRTGLAWGVVFGALWTVEIGYNNVLAPPIAVRDPVDDAIWAIIALGMLVLSVLVTVRTGRSAAGLRAGLWSGLASGLIACLTALALAVFGMPLLLADPANIAEYAVRGPTSGFSGMDAYLAYQTLAGGMLHLVILGIGMGALLGLVGGALGRHWPRMRS